MEVRSRRGCEEGPEQCLWLRRCCTPAPEGSTVRTIAGLDKKLVRKRAPRRVCSRRPVQTKLDEELTVRLSGKGKNLVRKRAPRRWTGVSWKGGASTRLLVRLSRFENWQPR